MKRCGEILHRVLETKGARIKLLGDSITHGVGGTGFKQNGVRIVEGFARNPDGYCWSNRFKKYLEDNFNCSVVINACTGTKIEFVIANFNTLVEEDDDLIICMIGTNNRHIYHKNGYKLSREELGTEFYNNVFRLNELLSAAGKEYILLANIPASQENESDGADFWRILHMEDINAIYKKAQEKLSFPFISLYDRFSSYLNDNGLSIDDLLCDGLHPNDKGHDVIFSLLLEELGLTM